MYDNKLFIEYLQKMKSTALITSNYFKGKAKQTTTLKRLLTIAEFTEKTFGLFNCNNKSCESCNYLLFGEHSSLKNAKIIFCLEERFACNSSNLIYLVVCPAYKYIGETRVRKTKTTREREKEYIGNTAVKSRGTSLNLQKRQNSNSFSTTYVIKRHKV